MRREDSYSIYSYINMTKLDLDLIRLFLVSVVDLRIDLLWGVAPVLVDWHLAVYVWITRYKIRFQLFIAIRFDSRNIGFNCNWFQFFSCVNFVSFIVFFKCS